LVLRHFARWNKQLIFSEIFFGTFVSIFQTNSDDDDDFLETREAHYLVEEFMVLSNHTVGKYLASRFKNCVPLRIQKPPDHMMTHISDFFF
jgi:exoribonuclease R